MTDYARLAGEVRTALYTDLEKLDDGDWATTTVCDPWTVRHLVAHMTALGNQTVPNFFGGFIKSGFNFDKFVDRDLQKYDSGSNADVLAGFEKTLSSTKKPPAPKYIPLGEYMCHGEDIRAAVGNRGTYAYSDEQISALGPSYAKTKAPLDGKRRAEGLRLVASDSEWRLGDGPEVTGPGVDLILAMVGRPYALDNLDGEGLDTLRSRCP